MCGCVRRGCVRACARGGGRARGVGVRACARGVGVHGGGRARVRATSAHFRGRNVFLDSRAGSSRGQDGPGRSYFLTRPDMCFQ